MLLTCVAYPMNKKPLSWLKSYHVSDNGTIKNWNFALVPSDFKQPFRAIAWEEYDPENNFWLLIGNNKFIKYKEVILSQAQLMVEVSYSVIEDTLPSLLSDTKADRRKRLILQEVLMLPCLDLQGLTPILDDFEHSLQTLTKPEDFKKLKSASISAWRSTIAQFFKESHEPSFDTRKRASGLIFFLMVKNVCSQGLLALESINDKLEEVRAFARMEKEIIKNQNAVGDYLYTRYVFKKHANETYLETAIVTHLKQEPKNPQQKNAHRRKKRR